MLLSGSLPRPSRPLLHRVVVVVVVQIFLCVCAATTDKMAFSLLRKRRKLFWFENRAKRQGSILDLKIRRSGLQTAGFYILWTFQMVESNILGDFGHFFIGPHENAWKKFQEIFLQKWQTAVLKTFFFHFLRKKCTTLTFNVQIIQQK